MSGGRRAPTSGPTRFGAPASQRNFEQSSSSGSSSRTLLVGAGERANKERAWGSAYVASDDSIRNDYAGEYVRTGVRPQNVIANTSLETRFDEYPKLRALLRAKHALLDNPKQSVPPVVLAQEPREAVDTLASARFTFDVILVSPTASTTYEELSGLAIPRIASSPGFIWLWVGSGQPGDGIGLENGRDLLASWGYRRCEDIVWLKTNKTDPSKDLLDDCSSLLRPTIEHCLMGIRGTVRRSNDGWFAHCNVDTDVIVAEPCPLDPEMKPQEIQTLIENFCLGTRRLHLYACPTSARRGWLSVGATMPDVTKGDTVMIRPIEHEATQWHAVSFAVDQWRRAFSASATSTSTTGFETPTVPPLLPLTEEIDNLRPKSPPGRPGVPSSGGLGRGRGAGLGVTRSEAANRIGTTQARGRGLNVRRTVSGPPVLNHPLPSRAPSIQQVQLPHHQATPPHFQFQDSPQPAFPPPHYQMQLQQPTPTVPYVHTFLGHAQPHFVQARYSHLPSPEGSLRHPYPALHGTAQQQQSPYHYFPSRQHHFQQHLSSPIPDPQFHYQQHQQQQYEPPFAQQHQQPYQHYQPATAPYHGMPLHQQHQHYFPSAPASSPQHQASTRPWTSQQPTRPQARPQDEQGEPSHRVMSMSSLYEHLPSGQQ